MKWISVKDKAPPLGENVLVAFASSGNILIGYRSRWGKDEFAYFTNEGLACPRINDPAYWMHLPPLPRKEADRAL